ncbi:hypothetical protein N7522_013966 [Penicillium canescens]|nr:hypothetical protein N7522_013966 [Penicillium canescens]
MKEAFTDKNISLTIRDTDIPVPKAGHVLIRVATTDGTPTNQGDDIAGYIEALGERVIGFHKGDRVAAYAEYTIAPDYITFYIPAKTRFKDVARGGHYSASYYDYYTRSLSALKAASALESDH